MARVPVIKAVNLTKEFDLGKVKVTALNGVNLEVYSGEFVVFFGPSGCGKSTLMSMIAGLQPPTKGKMLIRGEDLSKLDENELSKHRRTKIGMIFQAFNLVATMNVVENIALPLAFARIPRKRRLKRAENMLETVGLAEFSHHTPSELSGGQQQKIAMARSLVANPWIMLADEPTGNLDSRSANDVVRLLISLNRKSKRTVALISHNPEYLVYADRVFHLKDGKVIKVEVNAHAKKTVSASSEPTRKDRRKKQGKKGDSSTNVESNKASSNSTQDKQDEELPEEDPSTSAQDDNEVPEDVVEDEEKPIKKKKGRRKTKKKEESKKKSKIKPMRLG